MRAAAREAASDAAWVAANRALASAAMIPPLAPAPSVTADRIDRVSTLEEYLSRRQWPHADEPPVRRLVSAALSFPLTIAHFSALVVARDHRAVATATCIGARAEATLPTALWHELALATERDWALEMVGPHVLPNAPPRTSGRVALSSVAACYHDLATARPRPDLFCLFNPGMGQPEWADSWRPTVRFMRILTVAFHANPSRPFDSLPLTCFCRDIFSLMYFRCAARSRAGARCCAPPSARATWTRTSRSFAISSARAAAEWEHSSGSRSLRRIRSRRGGDSLRPRPARAARRRSTWCRRTGRHSSCAASAAGAMVGSEERRALKYTPGS